MEGKTVIIAGDFKNLGNIFDGKSEGERLVAAVASVEGLLLEEEGDQCNMAAIHGLNGESLAVDFDVDHLHQLLQGVNDLSEEGAFF